MDIQRYQQDVLAVLLTWTITVGSLAGLLTMVGHVFDPLWTSPIASGLIFLLALIAAWCHNQVRHGMLQRAARVYMVSGIVLMAALGFVASPADILLALLGSLIFVVIATFFTTPEAAIWWGVASAILYLLVLLARNLVPSLALGFHIDVINLYVVPPIVLVYFAVIGRTMTSYLLAALRDSELARARLAMSYAEVEQRVAERTHDLVEERNRLNAAMHDLAIARDQAEAANRAKSTFLANMSHELRTPLTAVLGYTDLIKLDAQAQNSPHLLADLNHINAAGQHLLSLINTLLDLAKIEAGKMDLHVAPVNLTTLVGEVVESVQPLIDKNTNTLTVQGVPETGSYQLDQTKVRQVLINLLANAAKFTDNGSITLTIACPAVDEVQWIRFEVVDTGIGITSEQLPHLFQPFSQGRATTSRVYGGSGLGLAICHRFCEAMGGRIEVASIVHQGTSFTVWLPELAAGSTVTSTLSSDNTPDAIERGG